MVSTAGLLAIVVAVARNAGLEAKPARPSLSGRPDPARSDEILERASEGPLRDLRSNPSPDVGLRRVREALKVLQDERAQPVRLNARERRECVEPGLMDQNLLVRLSNLGSQQLLGLRRGRMLPIPVHAGNEASSCQKLR